MNIKIEHSINKPIVVLEKELKLLTDFLILNYSSVYIYFDCLDGSSISTDSIDDLLEFENANFRKIKSLRIVFEQSNPGNNKNPFGGLVWFGNDLDIFSHTCGFSFNDIDEAKALRVANEINRRFGESKVWYSNFSDIARYGVLTVWLLLIMASGLYLMNDYANSAYYNARTIKEIDEIFDNRRSFLSTSLVLISIISAMAFSAISILGGYKAWNYFFPRIWFDIGKQKTELLKRKRIAGWIFTVIIAGLFVGVVGGLISYKITG